MNNWPRTSKDAKVGAGCGWERCFLSCWSVGDHSLEGSDVITFACYKVHSKGSRDMSSIMRLH